MKARLIKPGVVIDRWDDLWLVISQETPAGTVPTPEAKRYCEPGLVKLAHQREDRWVQTHEFSYALFSLNQDVQTNDSVRVQVPARTGRFLTELERVGMDE